MKTSLFAVIVVFLLVAGGAMSNGQEKPIKSFLSGLGEGQVLMVKEAVGKYELRVDDDIHIGSTVIEFGTDYILLDDPSGLIETRVHVTSIKCVTRLKLPIK